MTTLADDTIAALRANRDDLARRVASFSGVDLARPSGSAEWSVADVLSHLGSGAEIALASLRSARSGQRLAPASDQVVWDRWNVMEPAGQAAAFLRASDDLVAELEALSEIDRRDLRIDLGFLPDPVDIATYAGLRLVEAALHGWDVRVAADPGATLPPHESALLIAQLTGTLHFLLDFWAHTEELAPGEHTLRVETTDPELALDLMLGPRAALVDAAADDPEGVIACPVETFVRLLSGRLRDRDRDRITLARAALTLDTLTQVFPGY